MIDGLFGSTSYLTAKKMLDVTVLRQQAIASNLANVETPNYKRLDVSQTFESQLRQAVGQGDNSQISNLQPELTADYSSSSGRGDGNTVQLETEMLKLNQNSLEHAVETQLVSSTLMKLRMAITGKS